MINRRHCMSKLYRSRIHWAQVVAPVKRYFSMNLVNNARLKADAPINLRSQTDRLRRLPCFTRRWYWTNLDVAKLDFAVVTLERHIPFG